MAKNDWMGTASTRLVWLFPAVSGAADFGAAEKEQFVPVVERASENPSS